MSHRLGHFQRGSSRTDDDDNDEERMRFLRMVRPLKLASSRTGLELIVKDSKEAEYVSESKGENDPYFHERNFRERERRRMINHSDPIQAMLARHYYIQNRMRHEEQIEHLVEDKKIPDWVEVYFLENFGFTLSYIRKNGLGGGGFGTS